MIFLFPGWTACALHRSHRGGRDCFDWLVLRGGILVFLVVSRGSKSLEVRGAFVFAARNYYLLVYTDDFRAANQESPKRFPAPAGLPAQTASVERVLGDLYLIRAIAFLGWLHFPAVVSASPGTSFKWMLNGAFFRLRDGHGEAVLMARARGQDRGYIRGVSAFQVRPGFVWKHSRKSSQEFLSGIHGAGVKQGP